MRCAGWPPCRAGGAGRHRHLGSAVDRRGRRCSSTRRPWRGPGAAGARGTSVLQSARTADPRLAWSPPTSALGPGQVQQAVRAAAASAPAERRAGDRPSDLRRGARAQNAAGLERLARRIEPAVGWDDIVLPPAVLRGQLQRPGRPGPAPRQGADRVADAPRRRPRPRRDRAVRRRLRHRQDDVGRGDRRRTSGWTSTRSTWRRWSTSTSARPRRTSSGSSPRPAGSTPCCSSTRRTRSSASAARCATRTTGTPTSRAPTCCSGMETFDGLAVLATNLRANIDEAFTRRLDMIIDFPAPDEELRLVDLGALPRPPAAAAPTTWTWTSAPSRSSCPAATSGRRRPPPAYLAAADGAAGRDAGADLARSSRSTASWAGWCWSASSATTTA